MENRVQPVPQVHLALPDHEVKSDLLDLEDFVESQALPVHRDRLAQPVLREKLVHLDQLVLLDQEENVESLAPQVHLEKPDLLVFLDLVDLEENVVQLVQVDRLAPPDLVVKLDRLVPVDPLDLVDHPDRLDRPENVENQDLLDLQVQLVNLDH